MQRCLFGMAPGTCLILVTSVLPEELLEALGRWSIRYEFQVVWNAGKGGSAEEKRRVGQLTRMGVPVYEAFRLKGKRGVVR